MSLISVLVSGSIASIIALAIASLFSDASRSQKSFSQTIEANNLTASLNILLADPVACTKNFGPTSAFGALSLGPTLLTRDLVSSVGLTVYDVDSAVSYQNNALLVKSYTYENMQIVSAGSPYKVVGKLTLNLEKTTTGGAISVGGKSISRSLILNTTLTGAGGTVVDCSSAGMQTNSISMNCPLGQVVTGFVSGIPVCSAPPTLADINCAAGDVMTGVVSGTPVCAAGVTIAASSYAPNGYIQYSNGFTIQWGQHFFPSDITYTINYPLAFNQVFSVVISGTDCAGGNCQDNAVDVRSTGLVSFTASSARNPHNSWWMAYGTR